MCSVAAVLFHADGSYLPVAAMHRTLERKGFVVERETNELIELRSHSRSETVDPQWFHYAIC